MQIITSPNHWTGRADTKPRWVIVHGTAGGNNATNIALWFANPAAQVSAHYVIGLDGTAIQCVDEADTAWACGVISGIAGVSGDGVHHDAWWDAVPGWQGGPPNPNLVTISIEHVKLHIDNGDVLTAAQQATSFTLINDICDHWGIPKRAADASGGITGHFSIDPLDRSRCPGPYPWQSLWNYLTQQGGIMVPQGWHDDGAMLTAPNGVKVISGFRQFVLANQWSQDNWPLELEHAAIPLEISNPSLGNGTQQVFRWSMLGWTAQHGVFSEWIGEELLALRAKIASLEAMKLVTPSISVPVPTPALQPTQSKL